MVTPSDIITSLPVHFFFFFYKGWTSIFGVKIEIFLTCICRERKKSQSYASRCQANQHALGSFVIILSSEIVQIFKNDRCMTALGNIQTSRECIFQNILWNAHRDSQWEWNHASKEWKSRSRRLNRAGVYVTDGGQVAEWSSVAKLNSCPFCNALWIMLTFLPS